MQNGLVNRRGNRPGLERKPPLKKISDPANLESKNPAIKKAAEIKQQEDLAKQKIKALKYLATVGCGCYPGVKEAMMAALDDCTEKVRIAAAEQIGEAAENKCEVCSKSCCCDEELTKKLAEIAYERDDHGCFVEPSESVREAAIEAIRACCSANNARRGGRPVPMTPPRRPATRPIETIEKPGAPESIERPGVEPETPDEAPTPPPDEVTDVNTLRAVAKRDDDAFVQITDKPGQPEPGTTGTTGTTGKPGKPGKLARPIAGRVVGLDTKVGTLDIEFQGRRTPPVGQRLTIKHQYAFEQVHVGEIQIVYVARNGRAIAQPVGKLRVLEVSKGDDVSSPTATKPKTKQAPTPKMKLAAKPNHGDAAHSTGKATPAYESREADFADEQPILQRQSLVAARPATSTMQVAQVSPLPVKQAKAGARSVVKRDHTPSTEASGAATAKPAKTSVLGRTLRGPFYK